MSVESGQGSSEGSVAEVVTLPSGGNVVAEPPPATLTLNVGSAPDAIVQALQQPPPSPATQANASHEIERATTVRLWLGGLSFAMSAAFVFGFASSAAATIIDVANSINVNKLWSQATIIFIAKAVIGGAGVLYGFALLKAAKELTRPLLLPRDERDSPAKEPGDIAALLRGILEALKAFVGK